MISFNMGWLFRKGVLLIILILPAFLGCASISKSTVTVTPSIKELAPGV